MEYTSREIGLMKGTIEAIARRTGCTPAQVLDYRHKVGRFTTAEKTDIANDRFHTAQFLADQYRVSRRTIEGWRRKYAPKKCPHCGGKV